jgi:hypothetical protein
LRTAVNVTERRLSNVIVTLFGILHCKLFTVIQHFSMLLCVKNGKFVGRNSFVRLDIKCSIFSHSFFFRKNFSNFFFLKHVVQLTILFCEIFSYLCGRLSFLYVLHLITAILSINHQTIPFRVRQSLILSHVGNCLVL